MLGVTPLRIGMESAMPSQSGARPGPVLFGRWTGSLFAKAQRG
jgi:hypothetical protein